MKGIFNGLNFMLAKFATIVRLCKLSSLGSRKFYSELAHWLISHSGKIGSVFVGHLEGLSLEKRGHGSETKIINKDNN